MATVDMKSWYETNKLKLEELEEDFVDAMLEDENFFRINRVGTGSSEGRILLDSDLDFKNSQSVDLKPIDDLLLDISKIEFVLPDKPEGLDSSLIERHKEHVFDDRRLDGFESKLKGIYSSFSTPSAFSFNGESLQHAIQTAFYDYQYHRDRESLITDIDNAANAWAADGFVVGPGSLSFDISEKIEAFDRQRVSKTENVFANLAEVVQKNIQQSITDGVAIEKLHMDFAIKYSELSKTFIQSTVDAYIAEVQKRSKEQQAYVAKINAVVKSMELDNRADVTKYKLEIKERTARLAGYIAANNVFIQESAKTISEQIKLAENIAEGYGGIFSSYGSLFTGISYEE